MSGAKSALSFASEFSVSSAHFLKVNSYRSAYVFKVSRKFEKKHIPAPSGIGLSPRNQINEVFGLESFAVQASCNNSPARTGSGFPKVTLLGGTEKYRKTMKKKRFLFTHWEMSTKKMRWRRRRYQMVCFNFGQFWEFHGF